jgi:hypothetical protein
MTHLDTAVSATGPRVTLPQLTSCRQVILHDVSSLLGSTHERATREELARRVAKLKDWKLGSPAGADAGARKYLLPNDTIVGIDMARALGVNSETDFLGGVVPTAFMATKAITHGLVDETSYAPAGWSHEFAKAVENVVLHGYTCFTPEDARIAGSRLLQKGPFRLKPVNATGGQGQKLIKSLADMESILENTDADELMRMGLVIEEDLHCDVVTYSVGQVRIADTVISYYGVQHLVANNEGRKAYGGSDLTVIKGGLDDLFAMPGLVPSVREAVGHVLIYDAAANRYLPGLLASRRNYDFIRGTSASGQRCTGVLEQSWRIGGATPAEITALEGFRDNPQATQIRASAVEVYGEIEYLPENAIIYFQGLDENVGPITKYAYLKTDECGRDIYSG